MSILDVPSQTPCDAPVVTSPLGFGCSQLLGPKSRDEAKRLLAAAYDAGITHFDVARSYGYGDAEGVLGEFLAGGRRERVTVTSKFGIRPPKLLGRQRLLLLGARRLMRLAPFVRRMLSRGGAKLVERGLFTVAEATRSLETSLRQLRSDYIDIYLLHDCEPQDCRQSDLLEFLMSARKAGKIRAFGVGSSIEAVSVIVREAPEFARVVQFQNSVTHQHVVGLPEGDDQRALFTHGAFHGYVEILKYLNASARRAAAWTDAIGVDCRDGGTLSALMLHYAMAATGGGTVLFSSTRAENIAANAAAAVSDAFSRVQMKRFAELARTVES